MDVHEIKISSWHDSHRTHSHHASATANPPSKCDAFNHGHSCAVSPASLHSDLNEDVPQALCCFLNEVDPSTLDDDNDQPFFFDSADKVFVHHAKEDGESHGKASLLTHAQAANCPTTNGTFI